MKKGQGVQFNWIFVIVAGIIILAFFATFAVRYKDLQTKKDNAEIARGIDNLFYGLSATTQHNSINAHWVFNFDLDCDEFTINNDYIQHLDEKIVFGADEINTSNLFIWTKEFKKPFRVANLIYVIDPDQEYYLVGDSSILRDFPSELNINRIDSFTGDEKGVFVLFRDILGVNELKERGSVIQVEGDVVKFLNSGREEVFFDEATLLAAIFSEDYDNYKCGFDKLIDKYDNMRKIYYGKSIYVDSLSNCDYGLIKGILRRTVNQNNIDEFSDNLAQENDRLWYEGCEVIF